MATISTGGNGSESGSGSGVARVSESGSGSSSGGPLACEACATVANSAEQLRQHLASTRHINRLEELKLDPNAPLVPRTKRPRKEGKDAEASNGDGGSGNSNGEGEGGSGEVKAEVSCDLCSLKFTSNSQLEAHTAGKKHKLRAEGGRPVVEEEEAKASTTSTAEQPVAKKPKIIFCSVCNLSFNHQGQYDKHLSGKRHLAGGVKQSTFPRAGGLQKPGARPQASPQRFPPLIGGGGAYNPAVYGYPPYAAPAPRAGPAFQPQPSQPSYQPYAPAPAPGAVQRVGFGSQYGGRVGGGGSGGSSEDYTALFVFHIPPHVDESYLEELFKPYGQLHSIKVMRDATGTSKGYAFVNYLRYEDAQQAVKTMHGYPLDGKYLKVTVKS